MVLAIVLLAIHSCPLLLREWRGNCGQEQGRERQALPRPQVKGVLARELEVTKFEQTQPATLDLARSLDAR